MPSMFENNISAMDRILYIGRLNSGKPKDADGVQIKNQVFVHHLRNYFKVRVIDLDDLRAKCKFLTYPKICWTLVCHILLGGGIFIASGGSSSSCKLIRLAKKISFGNPIIIVGLGGNMHLYITASQENIDSLKGCTAIMAEGKEMVQTMHKAGLKQAMYVPNCKEINYLPKKVFHQHDILRFVFFARINPAKGCDIIFEAIDILNKDGYKNKFSVDFYGYKLESYAKDFDKKIALLGNNINYQGARLATNPETFDELASYDVMLFPTYWKDEGFPGTIIDAYVAGLPVIASDWKCNGELIKDYKNGFLIPSKDSKALAEKMKWFIEHAYVVPGMAKRIQFEAKNYDIRNVLNEDFLKSIGLNV